MSLLKSRLATESDMPFIDALVRSETKHGHFVGTLKDESVHEKWMSDVSDCIVIAQRGAPAALSVQMLTVGDEPVGFIILRSAPNPDEIDLNVLAVAPEHRRKGYGRDAVIDLLEVLKPVNKKVFVRCFPASTAMMSLLTSLGFAERRGAGHLVRHFISAR
jgi:GNAT superfamily N-acetyltransferase